MLTNAKTFSYFIDESFFTFWVLAFNLRTLTMMKRRQLIHNIASGLSFAAGSKLVGYQPARASRMKLQGTSSNKTDYQVIVIGAGAAGLAAARYLQDARYEVLVLEARDRIGGRVQTDYSFASHPIELGAEYIQGNKITTWGWVKQYGLKTLPVFENLNRFEIYFNSKRLSVKELYKHSELEALDFLFSSDSALFELADEWVNGGKPDTTAAKLLTANNVRFSPESYRLVDNSFGSEYGANLQQLGVYGLLEASDKGDGNGYFRLQAGYSHLFKLFGNGLNIRHSTPVTKIAWSPKGVQLQTQNNTTFTAKKLVITVPLALLQKNVILFEPVLPTEKRTAIDGLGLGHITKLILKFDKPFWSEETEAVLTTLDTQMWWRPGWGQTKEAPVLTAYTGSVNATNFSAMGRDAVINTGLQDLQQVFDISLEDRLVDALFVDWGIDPYSQMAYSYVPVGGTGLRNKLAQPIENVLFFAGEATHVTRPSTVHGAIESGLRAAREIVKIKSSMKNI